MPARILVIEDNPTNLELLSYIIKAYGHEVLAALDGIAGIDIAHRLIPDVIICDIQMPQIDGYEVARRLRSTPDTAAIPLVAVSALAMVGDRRRVMAAGFDGYITKPINPETIMEQLAAYLPGKANAVLPQKPAARPNKQEAAAACLNIGSVILVIDNVRDNIAFARIVLEASGFRVISIDNIMAGLALARRDPPALILCDLHMPDGDGVDLLRAVKADPQLRSIPFVFLSSTVWIKADTARAAALGADRFLSRPIEPQTLLAAIRGVLGADGGS
jgi:two-component system cell cycle response regulator